MTVWHRDRMINRISVASIVGENEQPGFDMSKLHTPHLQTLGIRARCHVLPGRGHSAPPPAAFDAAFQWLDQAATDRGRKAESRPVLRIQGNISREEFARAALEDCASLLEDDETIFTSLKLLEEIQRRWADLPEADEAAALLDEYANREEQPWIEGQREKQLAESRLLAQNYESAARALSGLNKTQRAAYAMTAISNYMIIARDTTDESEATAAEERIRELQPVADNLPQLRRPPVRKR